MWMDKRSKVNNKSLFLKIKTGIDVYRTVFIFLLGLSLIGSIICLIFKRENIEIIILFLLSFVFFLLALNIDKLVYILNLPTNYLLIYKDKFIYVKKKKQLIFEINNIKYEFHSFFENLESLSRLVIIEGDKICYFCITKKQFKSIKNFLQNEN